MRNKILNILSWTLRDLNMRLDYVNNILLDVSSSNNGKLTYLNTDEAKAIYAIISLNIRDSDSLDKKELKDMQTILLHNINYMSTIINDIKNTDKEHVFSEDKAIPLLCLVKDDFTKCKQEKIVIDKIIKRINKSTVGNK